MDKFASAPSEGARRLTNYAEFWGHYLREHSRPRTRIIHYVGTALVIISAAAFAVTGGWLFLLAMPVAGYGFAWASHALVECNRPATFTHPLWSLVSDFRMFFLAIAGRLGPHLVAAGVDGGRPR